MSTKEYLKMADMFELPVNDDDRKAAVDLFSHMVTTPYSVDYTVTMSKYAAHAINSHDELVAENERLVSVLWEVDRVLSEIQKNGVFVYGLDDLIDEVNHSIQS